MFVFSLKKYSQGSVEMIPTRERVEKK